LLKKISPIRTQRSSKAFSRDENLVVEKDKMGNTKGHIIPPIKKTTEHSLPYWFTLSASRFLQKS